MLDTVHLSVTDTAKLIRASLKESFGKAVTFSVRSKSYSGGASIDVHWTDGPTVAQVEAVIGRFQGGYFDGMTDYKGSVVTMFDGKPTRFGADFMFTHRDSSPTVMNTLVERLHDHYDWRTRPGGDGERVTDVPRPRYVESRFGGTTIENYAEVSGIYFGGHNLPRFYDREAAKRSCGVIAHDSPTARRVGPTLRTY